MPVSYRSVLFACQHERIQYHLATRNQTAAVFRKPPVRVQAPCSQCAWRDAAVAETKACFAALRDDLARRLQGRQARRAGRADAALSSWSEEGGRRTTRTTQNPHSAEGTARTRPAVDVAPVEEEDKERWPDAPPTLANIIELLRAGGARSIADGKQDDADRLSNSHSHGGGEHAENKQAPREKLSARIRRVRNEFEARVRAWGPQRPWDALPTTARVAPVERCQKRSSK
ncbi:hypothetical protein SPI_07622 [Niveomyces insectorum RCEF 264]|uniref:Uncharacterized protein n=1 Tax=Niveomyces insectorum RCEF 264 TaxID=1081102 RepID=A0A162IG09_9HYPO|nr:hypothetical protein SPI_07622 [Niveomyces insectorum RCEF 264]